MLWHLGLSVLAAIVLDDLSKLVREREVIVVPTTLATGDSVGAEPGNTDRCCHHDRVGNARAVLGR